MSTSAEHLYRAHSHALFRYLVRMSGDPDVAADVLHDAFAKLLASPPPTTDNVRAWLFRVATNLLQDTRRQSARRARLLSEQSPVVAHSDPWPAPDRGVAAREAGDRVRAVLNALPERDRAVLLMRAEGFTHREIGEAVGASTQSVGSLIARALGRVAKRAPQPETLP